MPTKKLLVRKILFILAMTYSLALVALSLANLNNLPGFEFKNIDKIYHAVAYFGLTGLWQLWNFANDRSKKFRTAPLFLVCSCAIAFGIFIEVLQGTLTAYRTWDLSDMLANIVGVLIAAICLVLMKNTLEKLKNKL